MAKVPKIVKNLNGGPVLIIADAILAELGVAERRTKYLADDGIDFELAADVSGEPKEGLVDDLCARARDAGARVIIGLGCGAAMDAAKLVAAIPEALPAECSDVSSAALAAEMRNTAKIGMSENAACKIGNSDLDELASLMVALPQSAAVH